LIIEVDSLLYGVDGFTGVRACFCGETGVRTGFNGEAGGTEGERRNGVCRANRLGACGEPIGFAISFEERIKIRMINI
jgi:hypothetical protein